MGKAACRMATYDDLVRVDPRCVAELLAGELFVSPRPASGHALASSILGAQLGGPYGRRPGEPGGPGGWWILDEPELHFGDDVLVPDLAGWRRERMPVYPEDAPWFDLAPDWVCEVLSRGTGRLDRIRKMPVYARAGVAHAWLVDPGQRTLEVYRRHGEHWLLVGQYEGDAVVRAEPFEATPLEMERWWPPAVEGG